MLTGMTTSGTPLSPPRLLLVAHGTRSAAGRRELSKLLLEARKRLTGGPGPEVDCRMAWVDIQTPTPDRVLSDGVPTVVVPVFLARGYHVVEDVGTACRQAPGPVALAEHLGAEPEVVRALVQRLAESGGTGAFGADAVILAAAGSSDPASGKETEALARTLTGVLGVPVTAAFATAATPTVAEAVTTARDSGYNRIAVLTHLLAPGFFADRIAAAGADIITPPLGAHPEIVDLLERRYRENNSMNADT